MDAAQLISDWITGQAENGKTDDDLNGTVFYKGNDSYTILKSKSRGKFDLKVRFGGAVDLVSLESK